MNQNTLRGKLAEVQQQISEREAGVKEKWVAFEQKREEFAKAGNEANAVDSAEFKAAEQIHKEYSSATAELKQLEQVRNGIFEMLASNGVPGISNQAPAADESK